MKQTIKILRFLPVLFLSACNHMPPEANILEGDERHWLKIHPKEKEYYQKVRNHSGQTPQLGLAISGGGQRAASVAIGFMESLDRSGILDEVDVISTVSGGSYAAYWWYSKHFWLEHEIDKEGQIVLRQVSDNGTQQKFFRRFNNYTKLCVNAHELESIPPCRPVKGNDYKENQVLAYKKFPYFYHMYNHGYLMNYYQGTELSSIPGIASIPKIDKVIRGAELVGKAIGFIPTIPVHWVANGIFDMKLNLNPFQTYYRNGLEREYGLYPECDEKKFKCEPLKSYANDAFFRTRANDCSSEDLQKTMIAQRLPFWVINTTAAYGTKPVPKLFRGEWSGYSDDLRHTVYEFTPFYQGSPWWGFCSPGDEKCETESIGLSRQIAISGAAIDSLPSGWNIALDLANLNLGQYIDNPKVSDSSRFIHRLIPAAFAWLYNGAHDTKAPFIYLSDGGHSDNLGLYSLVRRGVKKIIVLDAEQETHNGYQAYASFESLQSTRIHLWQEHGLLVDLEGIFGDFPVMDTPISAETLQFDYLKSSSPIFTGYICKAKPGQAHCRNDDPEKQELLYVKLAVDTRKFPVLREGEDDTDPFKKSPFDSCLAEGYIDKYPYSCLTLMYGMKQLYGNDTFPHNSTTDIFYSPPQYSGYVSLGADLGDLIKKRDSSGNQITYVGAQ